MVIEKENPRRAALLQGLFRTNAVLFCTAIGTSILGEGNIGPISLLVSVVVPLYNVLTVIELEIFRGGKIKPGKIALGVLKNPYIVAAILGYLTVALRIQLPVPVVTSLRDITRAPRRWRSWCWAGSSTSARCAATCATSSWAWRAGW